MQASPGAIGFVILFAFALYGWGCAVSVPIWRGRLCYPVFTTALGLAFVMCAGGVLTAAWAISRTVLGGILICGWTAAILSHALQREAMRSSAAAPRDDAPGARLFSVLVWGLAGAFTAFFAFTLLPTSSFNHVDDLAAYIVRPVRLLQLGGLGESPFDGAGTDSLGGHALMQAFFVAFLPLPMISAFEPVFGFALAAGLVLELGAIWRARRSARFLALVAFIVIPPLAVNVSTLYVGVALMLGLITAVTLAETKETPEDVPRLDGRRAVAIGLFMAGLMVAKSTFHVLLALFAAAWVVYAIAPVRYRYRPGRWPIMIALGVAGAMTLPWLVVHPQIVSPSALWIAPVLPDSSASVYPVGRWLSFQARRLFSTNEIFYGGAFISFTAASLGVLVLSAAQVVGALRPARVAVVGLMGAAGLSYFFWPYLVEADGGVRYAIPGLLAATPAGILFLSPAGELPRMSRALRTLGLALLGAGVVSLGGGLVGRLARMKNERTLVSYALDNNLRSLGTRRSMEPAVRSLIEQAQNRVPPGMGIWTWMSLPFHLDFTRNRILVANELGLASRSINLPQGGTAEDFRHLLRARGVEFLIVDRPESVRWTDHFVKALRRYPSKLPRHVAANQQVVLEMVPALLAERPVRQVFSNDLVVVIDIRH